jgi:hypothetical protein
MSDFWLVLLEIAVGAAVVALYLSARKAFSSEDIRRTVITENDRLAAAVEKLAQEFEARAQQAVDALDAAVARAESAAERLRELMDQTQQDAPEPERPGSPLPLAPKSAAPSDKHRRVVALAKDGRSVESIAKEVKLGTGEVELVLNISREGESPASYRHKEDECESGNPNGRS